MDEIVKGLEEAVRESEAHERKYIPSSSWTLTPKLRKLLEQARECARLQRSKVHRSTEYIRSAISSLK